MATKAKNEARNKLTEHQNNYKLCNLNLLSCYAGLYPATLTKLSLVIFDQIISNKMYYKKDSKYYDASEERRIYTNIPVNPVLLLENCHPVKYRMEGKEANKDVGNIVKRINELDENNIFYVWKCGFPRNYMFILERDIGLWKFYNTEGVVTPKTIRKIIAPTKNMVMSMLKILSESGDKSSIHDVRKSFCQFVDRMVGKMHPDVQAKLERWNESVGYKEYLNGLNSRISKMNAYEGLEEDEHFYDRLPLGVYNKLVPKKNTREEHKELEANLSPKDDNLVKETKQRKRVPQKNVEAKFETFKSLEPMKDSKSLVQFYRSVVKSKYGDAQFHEYRVEVRHAGVILDTIKGSGHDEEFLKSWILFFAESKLKGHNSKSKDKTSLKSLQETYSDYNSRYIGCGV